MRHSEFREWAEVVLGDSRQVYARKAGAPLNTPLVFMPDGATDLFRADARSGALICPVPDCQSPELHTRACTDRRDHFVHDVSPAREAEHMKTYTKVATENLLRDWAERQDRVVDLRAETPADERISLILVARLDNGSEVALCYVDKLLGAAAWEEHNDLLRKDGMAVAWFFALTKSYFSLPHPADPITEDRTDLILDKAIYRRMRKVGSWPLLVNLERKEFANVLKPGGGPATRLRLPAPDLDRVVHLVRFRPANGRLCPYGIKTPAIKESTLRKSSGRHP